jgi:hypothetical protein
MTLHEGIQSQSMANEQIRRQMSLTLKLAGSGQRGTPAYQ